jgi:alcohol dehydrogenase (NADP+)
MALAKAAFVALIIGVSVYLLALQYWVPADAPPARTRSHANVIREIPSIGIGTWLSDRDKVAHAVAFALDSGYNHIDAALIYSVLFPQCLRIAVQS